MIALSECLELARGKTPQDFVQIHPHPVIIGLGVLPGELQRNPAKASGTLFLNLSPDQQAASDSTDKLVNQVFEIRKTVSSGDPTRIEVGWSPQNDVDIPDHTISRSHAHFVNQGGALSLVDGGSTNGTWLNGTRVEAGKLIEIKAGDILTFGRYSFTYYDAMSFAKLLSVQAMMRPRSSRKPAPTGRSAANLAGGGVQSTGPARPAPTSSSPGRGADPFNRAPSPRPEAAGATPWPPLVHPSAGQSAAPPPPAPRPAQPYPSAQANPFASQAPYATAPIPVASSPGYPAPPPAQAPYPPQAPPAAQPPQAAYAAPGPNYAPGASLPPGTPLPANWPTQVLQALPPQPPQLAQTQPAPPQAYPAPAPAGPQAYAAPAPVYPPAPAGQAQGWAAPPQGQPWPPQAAYPPAAQPGYPPAGTPGYGQVAPGYPPAPAGYGQPTPGYAPAVYPPAQPAPAAAPPPAPAPAAAPPVATPPAPTGSLFGRFIAWLKRLFGRS